MARRDGPVGDGPVGDVVGDLDRDLQELLAASAQRAAAAARTSERALLDLAGAEATLLGTLVDLAEARTTVVVLSLIHI